MHFYAFLLSIKLLVIIEPLNYQIQILIRDVPRRPQNRFKGYGRRQSKCGVDSTKYRNENMPIVMNVSQLQTPESGSSDDGNIINENLRKIKHNYWLIISIKSTKILTDTLNIKFEEIIFSIIPGIKTFVFYTALTRVG